MDLRGSLRGFGFVDCGIVWRSSLVRRVIGGCIVPSGATLYWTRREEKLTWFFVYLVWRGSWF